jgi:hypothetical protein
MNIFSTLANTVIKQITKPISNSATYNDGSVYHRSALSLAKNCAISL